MIDEHTRLAACLKDLHQQKPIGRPAGVANAPQPPKVGPIWEAFVKWFAKAPGVPTNKQAQSWRAFHAGAMEIQKKP